MVELSVDKGDVEASEMEELGQLQHGADMALCWVWDAYQVRLQSCFRSHLILLLTCSSRWKMGLVHEPVDNSPYSLVKSSFIDIATEGFDPFHF